MKGKFYAPISLMQIEDNLKKRLPYSILIVSTTGLDNSAFDKNMPIRANLIQYSYNTELGKYEKEFNFDKLVDCGKEALEYALDNKIEYDVFKQSGIDEEQYIKGQDVLSQAEFKNEFDRVMEAVKESNSLLILNGGIEHCGTFLKKIDCNSKIDDLVNNNKVLEQTRITKEYFQTHNINKNATLKNLKDALTPYPKLSFINEQDKLPDFNYLSKEEFLKKYPDISEKAYEITKIDEANRNSLIDNSQKISIINNLIIKLGCEKNILDNDYDIYKRQEDIEYINSFSELGKEKYKNNNIDEKINILIKKGAIDTEKIENKNSEYHKLIRAINDNSKEGIIILHTATTGLNFKLPSPRDTGFPIQITAMAYPCKNGKLITDVSKNATTFNIIVPSRALKEAEENAKNPKGFDIFKDAGIDLDDYKNDGTALTREQAIDKLDKFFEKFPLDKYNLVTIGGANKSNRSFAQTSLMNMGNLKVCDVPSIDITQVFKDYVYIQNKNGNIKNVLLGDNQMQGKTFSLKDIAQTNGYDELIGTVNKCGYTLNCIKLMSDQYHELHIEKSTNEYNNNYEEELNNYEEELNNYEEYTSDYEEELSNFEKEFDNIDDNSYEGFDNNNFSDYEEFDNDDFKNYDYDTELETDYNEELENYNIDYKENNNEKNNEYIIEKQTENNYNESFKENSTLNDNNISFIRTVNENTINEINNTEINRKSLKQINEENREKRKAERNIKKDTNKFSNTNRLSNTNYLDIIEAFTKTVEKQNETIEKQNQIIDELNKTIEKQKETISNKEQRIDELSTRVDKQSEQLYETLKDQNNFIKQLIQNKDYLYEEELSKNDIKINKTRY